ncbi:hypothetical protein E2562_020106 [Oryza meyeriana var. granulata]|uniref:Uncharacterized protein n=1 Tax=Oryza meyeriana var. granulata TaxID=110450 RepID=A0A6G1EBL5_9ORYZ|nr:hypothetical protein E2562_020106 [Oryza meyeriana var. granulata]
MEEGGDAAVCVVVRYGNENAAEYAANFPARLQRVVMLMLYDVRAGKVSIAMKDERIKLFDYHSSMARILDLHYRA